MRTNPTDKPNISNTPNNPNNLNNPYTQILLTNIIILISEISDPVHPNGAKNREIINPPTYPNSSHTPTEPNTPDDLLLKQLLQLQ